MSSHGRALSEAGEGSQAPSSGSESTGGRKIRLLLKTTLDGQPTFIVETPTSVTVRQVKMALEVYRGIDVCSQTLALWRGSKGYVELDDVRSLNEYRLTNGDRLFLLPILRTGPGSGNGHRKSALLQMAEETNAELMKVMDRQVKRRSNSSPNICYILTRRPDGTEIVEESIRSLVATSPVSGPTIVERTIITRQLESETSSETLEKEAQRDEMTKEKVKALKAKMEQNRLRRESRPRPTVSTSTSGNSTISVSSSTTSTTTTSDLQAATAEEELAKTSTKQPGAPAMLICDQCNGEALSNGNGECPRCAGRFCAQHIIRTRHSCQPTLRCSVCNDLVLIAGGRYQCDQCQKPLCRKHIIQPCDGGHQVSSEKSSDRSHCRQQ